MLIGILGERREVEGGGTYPLVFDVLLVEGDVIAELEDRPAAFCILLSACCWRGLCFVGLDKFGEK